MTPQMGAFDRHRSERFHIHLNQDQRIRKTRRRYDDRLTIKLLKFGSIHRDSAVDNRRLISDGGCTANSSS